MIFGWIRLIIGIAFLLVGFVLFMETGFRNIFAAVPIFLLIFGIFLVVFGFRRGKAVQNAINREDRLKRIATILLAISVIVTILALLIDWGEGFAIFFPFYFIVPMYVISFILYIISIVGNARGN